MEFISLFSGIGGFDLGLERAGMKCVAQVEIDPFCQEILALRWPDVLRIGDIRDANSKTLPTAELVCGGFPCQPFSNAGNQKGTEDNRYLWPEMFRIIKEIKPRWVIGENVPGIVNMALDTVLSNLEGEGYTCETFIIPAVSVNAPHRRDRVWIMAYANSYEYIRTKRRVNAEEIRLSEVNRQKWSGSGVSCRTGELVRRGRTDRIHEAGDVAHAKKQRTGNERKNIRKIGREIDTPLNTSCTRKRHDKSQNKQTLGYSTGQPINERNAQSKESKSQTPKPRNTSSQNNVSDTDVTRLEGTESTWTEQAGGRAMQHAKRNWWAVEPGMGRVAYGVPDRVDRLKSLGNSVVPQIVEIFGKAIMEIEAQNVL